MPDLFAVAAPEGPAAHPLPTDAAPPDTAASITRGVRRAFAARGWVTVTEFSLKTGRRADILALDPKGGITIVEVKSCPADFRADRKWPDYETFCDRFYFAVDTGFPTDLLPDDRGLIVADAFDAHVVREARETPLPGPRRKALTLRLALTAARRLHRLEDPRC